MRFRFALSALFTAGFGMFGMTHDAQACGACISPDAESTVVTGHRMALSISPKQTVLWDQIEYAGSPASFAWVLPVKPGAIIELSTDAWFDTLDATTTTQIVPPFVSCGSDSNFGCGNSSKNSAGGALAAESSSCVFCDDESTTGGGVGAPPVTVVSRGSVGPYSMVTLSTDTPGALNTWLTENGFSLDPSTQPVVDTYVAEGFDFIALKLLPDKDVRAMKPVRVVQEGANPTLPLRMVAIGTGANVALTLFVISEGRWEAQNFGNTIIPSSLVAWDFKDSSSNYGELREKALAHNNGATWLTAFAFQGALFSPIPSVGGGMNRGYLTAGGFTFSQTIASAYVRQGMANEETTDDSCLDALDMVGKSKAMVTRPCPLDIPLDDPACGGSVGENEIHARSLKCGELDDLAIAMNGLHVADTWITRIEANLPRSALNTDLVLQAASLQTSEDNQKQAGMGLHPEVVCEGQSSVGPLGLNGHRLRPKGNNEVMVLATFALLALAALARKRSAFTWRLKAG